MSVMEQTYKYMQEYLYSNEYIDFLKENNMLYIMQNYLTDGLKGACSKDLRKEILYNKIRTSLVSSEMVRINKLLNACGINAIFFKGCVLARQLYTPIYARNIGDIDLYVGEEYIERAYECLIRNGYVLSNGSNIDNVHHVQLERHGILIELHRKIITPARNINIDETYMLSHTQKVSLAENEFITFDKTATLLHLIYHLYMHSTIDYKEITEKNQFFVQKYNLFVRKRFFMIFEIALYAEKYGKEIMWQDFLDELCSKNLYDTLREMFFDINIIYPNVFPCFVIEKILSIRTGMLLPYNAFAEYYREKFTNGSADAFFTLRNVIEKNWDSGIVFQCQSTKPTHYYEIDEYSLNKYNKRKTYIFQGNSPLSSDDASFKFMFWMEQDSFNLQVCVQDDIVIMDERCNHDYLYCDCFCVTFVTVGKAYRQSPIYVFLRRENEKVIAVPYDIVHGGKSLASIIDTNVVMTECGYEIDLSVPLDYIQFNQSTDDHFYMDLMLYDCDDLQNGVKTVLSVSSVQSEMYDPKEYIKVVTKDNLLI